MTVIVFGFLFAKMPAEADDQKRINKEYKIGALQNLLLQEKELDEKDKKKKEEEKKVDKKDEKEKKKEKKDDMKRADAHKLYDLLFDTVEESPVTCLGIPDDHAAYTGTLTLLKERINTELKDMIRKTELARGHREASEDEERDEEEEEEHEVFCCTHTSMDESMHTCP